MPDNKRTDTAGLGVNNIYNALFGDKGMKALILMGLIVFIFSLWHRYIYIDDAFFGEQAYWLAKDGIVKTPSMPGFLGCDRQLFSYHKLNIFVGAGLIKIFGWSVTPLRCISLLFFAGLVYMLVKYLKGHSKFTRSHIYLAVFFLFINPLIVLHAFTYRPEIWVCFFGFASYCFLEKGIREAATYPAMIAAGAFAGLAFLTHLNGLIFIVAGFILLLFNKKGKELLVFSASASCVSLLFFWDLWQGDNFSTWLYQLKNWPDNNATNYLSRSFTDLLKNVFAKLLSEHQRFFWSDRVWMTSTFFIISMVSNFKYLYANYRHLLIYLFTLIITLNVAGSQIAERYLIYFFPFFAIIIAVAITNLFETRLHFKKGLFIVMLIIHLFLVGKMFNNIISKSGDYPKLNDELLAKIPQKSALILAPYEFVFNGLSNYKLATFKGFEYYEVKIRHHLTQQEFFARADSLNINYIILNENYQSIPCFANINVADNALYRKIYSDSKTVILENRMRH